MNNQPQPMGPTDSLRGGVAWGWVLLSLAIQAGAVAPLFFCAIFVVPKFTMIFKDLGAPLPVLTQAVIEGGRILGNVIIDLPLVALLFLAAVGLGARRLHRALLWGWTAVVVAVSAVATATVMVALFLPMVTIIESMK